MRYINIPDSHYAVSDTGKIRNNKTNRLVIGRKDKRHYKVTIWVKDVPCTFRVHYLVATMFVPNPNNYRYIGFKDGNTLNRNYSNLYWSPKNTSGVGGGRAFPEWQDVL